MRKIETEMLSAVIANKEWSKDNTQVTPHAAGCTVFLHGNIIADIDADGRAWANRATLADWPTPTTKSRLRALGVNLTQSRGVISIDGEVICNV